MPPERHEGITGYALWKVRQAGGIRLRLVEYVYYVGDNADSHRSFTERGVTLFIVD